MRNFYLIVTREKPRVEEAADDLQLFCRAGLPLHPSGPS